MVTRRWWRHRERHHVDRMGWLRAAVLGANDGILSTASLLVGVAASNADRNAILVAGLAGLVAGAMSMAAGEYVSVSSQRDSEQADIAREQDELADAPAYELEELAQIYVERGLDRSLAREVAKELMAKDALAAHLRDELGITEVTLARPLQAAAASAASFTAGAAVPLVAVVAAPTSLRIPLVVGATLLALALLGGLGGEAGGAPPGRAALRVASWGAAAMAATWVIGRLVGTAV